MVTGPVLVAAWYSEGASVLLAFDRAINTGAMVAADVTVYDGPNGNRLVGVGELGKPTDESVQIELTPGGSIAVSPDVTLDAPGGAGIVSTDGDEPWAGVAGVVLPFP